MAATTTNWKCLLSTSTAAEWQEVTQQESGEMTNKMIAAIWQNV